MPIESAKPSSEKLDIFHKIISPSTVEFLPKDVLQVLIGASILAIPVGFTEETWSLGATLPMLNIIGFIVISLLFIGAFTYYHYHKHTLHLHKEEYVKRVIFTYIIAFIVVAILLALIQKAPWSTDWILAFKRTVIVAFPSSMSGAIADTIR